ncbi:PTS galactitol transporter subunit IIB, partial [Listeria monocytogenes]|nr:PTS galactitol transporter subunit IIB [Listeria monocytogenes]
MKKVIVACGSGVATSQTVASKVERILKEKGVRATVEAVDIKSLEQYIKTSDVYVAITKANKEFD